MALVKYPRDERRRGWHLLKKNQLVNIFVLVLALLLALIGNRAHLVKAANDFDDNVVAAFPPPPPAEEQDPANADADTPADTPPPDDTTATTDTEADDDEAAHSNPPPEDNVVEEVTVDGDGSATTTPGGNGNPAPPDDQPEAQAGDDVPDDDPNDHLVFRHFVAHNKTMTCSADEHARPFNSQIRGVSLGGWMVLEPWITPSLFYQFLGGNENTTAFDTYTFCQRLGPAEANRQLRRHWDLWVTEDIIADLASSGAVNSLRLPIGDYMFVPYGPYKKKQHGVTCFDGALNYLDQLLDWAYKHGLTVLLDIHTMKDSQNGFDNSGQTLGFQWTSALSADFADQVSFQHWPIRDARWMGTFDFETATYSSINYDNIQHALNVIQEIVDTYNGHPAVLGIEPLNEPWQFTPLEHLKRFYWEGYLIVKRQAHYWKYVMHDSFRLDPNVWGGFMKGCPERALDSHIYQAWRNPDSRIGFYNDACGQKKIIAEMERVFGPVVIGEWSLATDNCALWLNGFNDNLPGFPRLPCKYTPCGESYLANTEQPGVPLDPSKPLLGPYGTGNSGPIFGQCPGGRDWIKERTSGNPLTGQDWIRAPPSVPQALDDTDNVMTNLARKKINAFSGVGHGFYFWNFRTDLYEPTWSYMQALERGWIPRGELDTPSVTNACVREDEGAFRCILKRGQIDKPVHDAIAYIFNVQNLTETPEAQLVLNMTGNDLMTAASQIIEEFFDKNKVKGATCDFGGVAQLVEENVTVSDEDDDLFYFTDDEYFGAHVQVIQTGPPIWLLVVGGILIALIGSMCGFIVAMRTNPRFNRRVQSLSLFNPITRSSNDLIRNSLSLGALQDLGELERLVPVKS